MVLVEVLIILPSRKLVCNDRKKSGKLTNFKRAKKSSSLTPISRATSLHLIGDSLEYIETGGNKHAPNVFVSFEGTHIIQIITIAFYYKRLAAGSSKTLKINH